MDVVAVVEDDRHAVADHGGVAGQLGDVTDDLDNAGVAVGLRHLDVAGQRIDKMAGEEGAVGRGKRRVLVALEVILKPQLLVALADDEVAAAALEVAGEEELRVLDDDRIGRRLGGHRLDMRLRLRVSSRERQAAIEF
ncbi:hypothetical protein ES703_109894 [subsurface metagenome]